MLRRIFLPASALRSVLAQPGFLHHVRDSAKSQYLNLKFTNSFQQPRIAPIRYKSTMPLERSTDPLVWIDCEVRLNIPPRIQ